jgi:amidophosphoribosyltransferase
MIHNGNIVNTDQLASELKTKSRRHLLTHSDTEIILNLLADGLAKATSEKDHLANGATTNSEVTELDFDCICSAVTDVMKKLNGSYSIVTLVADHGLVAFRDPNGFRPLVWGKRPGRREGDRFGTLESGEAHMIASESVALSFLGYEKVRDIAPGEVLFIDMKGKVHSKVLVQKPVRHCMFEWVYFASPESEIDEHPVYGVRINLGKNLAKLIKRQIEEGKIKPDIVVPVPETSRIAAIALAEELKIPYREVLIKNRYIKRTFILDSQEKRQNAVNLKLSPVRSEIVGKSVLLVDDSIVRGTTSRKIIELVRQAGAEKVYFVSTCPPIQHPCYYGIDFPDENELIGSGRTLAQIEKELGADAVIYQDLGGLKHAIRDALGDVNPTSGISTANAHPCMACLDGDYPTDITAGRSFAETRTRDRKG